MAKAALNFDASGFVVNTLPSYVKENRDLILKNFALVGTATRKRISLQTGVKGTGELNYLNITPTLQSGAACGFSAAGSVDLTQKTVTTAIIKVDLDICPKTLIGKWPEYLVRIGANAENIPFEQYIVDGLTAEINKKIEKLIWQGDTTKTTDTDLKWINGFIYQFDNDAAVVDVNIANGTAIYNAIKAVYLGLTEEALDRGAEIYISPANYRAFVLALVEKNYFHYAGPVEAAPEEFYFPGTDVKVVKTPGLAGVDNKIVGTFPANLVYACDLEGDTEDVKVKYDDIAELVKYKAQWNSGVAYYFGEHVTLGTIASE